MEPRIDAIEKRVFAESPWQDEGDDPAELAGAIDEFDGERPPLSERGIPDGQDIVLEERRLPMEKVGLHDSLSHRIEVDADAVGFRQDRKKRPVTGGRLQNHTKRSHLEMLFDGGDTFRGENPAGKKLLKIYGSFCTLPVQRITDWIYWWVIPIDPVASKEKVEFHRGHPA